MKLFHATTADPKDIINNGFSLDYSGKAGNGDQQAAGIHLSTEESFVRDNYFGGGSSLLSLNLPISYGFEQYDGIADISIYQNILINFIGEELFSELVDDIEESIKDDAPLSFNMDIEDELYRSLIIYNNDLNDNLKEYFNIDKDLQKRIDNFLSHSFELDVNEVTHESCYNMLSSILGCRIKASKSLVEHNIDGFVYVSNHNNNSVTNYCVLNTEILKGKAQVVELCPYRNKQKKRSI